MNSFNVVHVADSLEFGGLERVMTDLAKEQLRRGYSVSVFSINSTEGLAPELAQAGIKVVQGHKSKTLDFAVLSKLRKLVTETKADIVHAHNFVPNYYAATATIAMRRPCLVGTCHDMGTRLSQAKLRYMYKASLLRTQRVAMVGKQVHDRFVNQGYVARDRAITVLNGVPIPKPANRDSLKDHARRELGLPQDALVIGTVGRLVELKNHAILIELLPRMRTQFPQLKVVIVGGGPLQDRLEDLAARLGVQDHVVFAGQRKNVGQLLYAFDIFALPSLTEGLSIALLEAAAAGLPIAATSVGGNPEIVKHMQTGLLMNAANKESTESALTMLLGDPNTRARLADQAAHWVKENASIESMCDAYDRLYLDALKARA